MEHVTKEKRAGWDDLYEDYFDLLNKVMEDNVNMKHNSELIERLFCGMLDALKKAVIRMNELPGEEKLKKGWYNKAEKIKNYAEKVSTSNEKVIAITMIDQFLRSTY